LLGGEELIITRDLQESRRALTLGQPAGGHLSRGEIVHEHRLRVHIGPLVEAKVTEGAEALALVLTLQVIGRRRVESHRALVELHEAGGTIGVQSVGLAVVGLEGPIYPARASFAYESVARRVQAELAAEEVPRTVQNRMRVMVVEIQG